MRIYLERGRNFNAALLRIGHRLKPAMLSLQVAADTAAEL
jgi:hypothetical protein